ncbi:MAG: hypothetical protein KBT63_10745 [Porticoccaceae bacterium]|nr:hypothetical protein [Porticoccaceae bacterium]
MISVAEDIACQRAAALINEALGEDPKRRDELAALGEATVVFNLTTGGTAADTAARLLPLLAGVIPETISTILLTLQHGELSLQPISGNSPVAAGINSPVASDINNPVADIKVHSTPLALGQWLWRNSGELPSGLTVEGDIARLLKILSTLRQLDIDWQNTLSDRIEDRVGDIPAHLFSQGIESARAWSNDGAQRVWESYANYRDEERHPKGVETKSGKPKNPLDAVFAKLEPLLNREPSV